jgi:hypothetical protein
VLSIVASTGQGFLSFIADTPAINSCEFVFSYLLIRFGFTLKLIIFPSLFFLLSECSRMMVDFHQKAGTGKLTGVHRKYSLFKFGCAAKVQPALFLLETEDKRDNISAVQSG